MNRAWGTLGGVAAATVSGIYFVHWRQQTERDRMHKGVLRDIEEERQQQLTAAALSQPVPADSASRACEGDVCDLVSTRFRDPKTGKVYVPAAPSAAEAVVR